jgi:hypothetical protein
VKELSVAGNKRLLRGWKTVTALALATVCIALAPPASSAKPTLSPGQFANLSSGVALIKTYTCGGRLTGEGSGFLVGDSVVMTARHVVDGACRVSVHVDGATFTATHWTYWYTAHTSVAAADVATIKLGSAATGAYIFRIRSSLPPLGANLSAVGYPLGHRLSLNQGTLWQRGRISGAPLIAVKMLGAEGSSGSAFLDDQGRVVGILQIGLGSKDIIGERTSGILLGLDLSRWWGARARLDLCHAYPHGGIAGCPGSKPPRPQPPSPPPGPTYHVTSCWEQYTGGSWSSVTQSAASSSFLGSDIIGQGATNYWAVVELDVPPDSPLTGAQLTLLEPNGQTFATETTPPWAANDSSYAVDLHWSWSNDGTLFFQHPELTGQGSWTFMWTFPDGETCSAPFTVS